MKRKLLFLSALLLAVNVLWASPEPGGPVTTISNVGICPGTSVVQVPVRVSNFTGVGSISLKFAYDASVIGNPHVVYTNPGLAAWETIEVNTTIPGTIIYSAFDPTVDNPVGLTLNDGETLFTLEFAVGPIVDKTSIMFVENFQGTSCEYGGTGPDYTPFWDKPASEYYIGGDVDVIDFNAGTIGNAQILCEGSDVAELSSIANAWGEDGVFATIQWQSSTTGADEGFTDIEGAVSQSYDPGTIEQDTWYRRKLTAELYGTYCYDYSNVIHVTVLNFAPGSISGAQTICEGDDAALLGSVQSASGDGLLTYQWQWSASGNPEDYANITDATAETYDPGQLTADTWYRRATTAAMDETSCTEYTEAVAVTVINFQPGQIAGDQTICAGNEAVAFTSVSTATGDGEFTYQWQSSTTNGSLDFVDIPDATLTTYDPGVVSVDTWYRRTATSTLNEHECSQCSNVLNITANQRKTISGIFYYFNWNFNIPMTAGNIRVELFKSSDLTHSTSLGWVMTNEAGYYEFTNLCPDCDYDIVATSNDYTDGAVNTTDAAQVNFWGAHSSPIEKVRFYAGDVGTTGEFQDLYVNATDAGRIQHHFVYGEAFDRPWTFWLAETMILSNPATEDYPSVTLAVGSDKEANMYGLCTGDFNMSYNYSGPVKAASATLDLIHDGSRQIGANQEFELPVRLVHASQIGAASLVLDIPSDLVEVSDVTMNGAGGQLDWNVKGNELRIGWNSSNPIYLEDNQELMTLHLRTTGAFTPGHSISISLAANPLNELADQVYEVISNVVLSVETVDAAALGIGEQPAADGFALMNYPNPFHNNTRIAYTLPFKGTVSLEVSSILGKQVRQLIAGTQDAGSYEVNFDMNDLPGGIYIATLRIKSSDNELVRTIKLTKN